MCVNDFLRGKASKNKDSMDKNPFNSIHIILFF